MKKTFQWFIALSCLAAAAFNLLYLTGHGSKILTSVGTLLIIACYVVLYFLKRNDKTSEKADDTKPLERFRVILTIVCAALWLITGGMTVFWKV